jgi:hypothetical protein
MLVMRIITGNGGREIVKRSFTLGVSNSVLGFYKMNRANTDIDNATIIDQKSNVLIED